PSPKKVLEPTASGTGIGTGASSATIRGGGSANLREGGREGGVEAVTAAWAILRCPQRGQPPARRDVRWPWPSTGEQGGAGYGGVGPLSGRASKGRGPGS